MEQPLAEGDEVDGKYVIIRHLGSGGMGHVFEAFDLSLCRNVALKVLSTSLQYDDVARERLMREGRAAARISHPGVVRVYEVGTDGETDYVAMELLRGETLQSLMERESRLTVAFVEELALALAHAMSAMHDVGIVHRDLKPQNVFLADEGNVSPTVKVLDFGVAKSSSHFAATLTETGQVFGTLHYMSPEQLRGAKYADARSDIWSAGAILYQALAGRRPFEAESAPELVFKVAVETPMPLRLLRDDVPASLASIIERTLAREPAQRFQSADELAKALTAHRQGPVSSGLADRTTPSMDSLAPVVRARFLGDATTLHAGTHPYRSVLSRAKRFALPMVAFVGLAGASTLITRRAPPRTAPAGMTWIDEGTMALGRSSEELDRECRELGKRCDRSLMQREEPSRVMRVAPFLIDVHEVTNQAFADTLNALASSLYVVDDEDDHSPRFVRWNKDLGHDGEFLVDLHPDHGGIEYTSAHEFRVRTGKALLPATQVSWYGARMHCMRLGKRLPTENEWEAAARGAEDRRFPWGNSLPECPGTTLALDDALVAAKGCREPAGAIGVMLSKQDVTPNGVYDLGGNVAEWVDSSYVEGNRHALGSDPQNLLPKVIRGGSWGASFSARTTARSRRPAGSVGANVGFRCASSSTEE